MRIWLIVGIALLAGCESEFDRCMKTELLNAEEALSIAGQEAGFNRAVEELKVYQGWISHMTTDRKIKDWFDENPVPVRGEEVSYYKWYESEPYKEYRRKEQEFMTKAAQAYGLPVSSYEEYRVLYNQWIGLMKDWIKPRSVTANCESEECIEGNMADLITVSLNEAAESLPKELEQNRLAIRKAAASACNTNGIYE